MILDTTSKDTDWRDIYKLGGTFIQPRPIALVSSVSTDGVRNLAPFSFYNMVSANPPVVFFAPSYKRDKSGKDSLHNAEAVGQFVIATVTEGIAEQMNQCAFEYAPGEDEFAASGLTPVEAKLVKPALVAESPVNMECELIEIRRFGEEPGAGCVVYGRVLMIHVDDAVLADDGLVDPAKLKAIGRMGRGTYCKTTDRFDMSRPKRP